MAASPKMRLRKQRAKRPRPKPKRKGAERLAAELSELEPKPPAEKQR